MARVMSVGYAVIVASVLFMTPVFSWASDVVAVVPGNTVVQDPAGDLQVRRCSVAQPDLFCSVPPGSPLDLPGWFDIKTAKITEIGGGRVELFIALYEPIPETPPVPFLVYAWQFEGGCFNNVPGDKDGIRVKWDGDVWSANFFVITGCNPRTIDQGDPVDFRFTEDGVRVRVALDDLLGDRTSVPWFALVRRLPFIHPIFTHTTPVDVAPDVFAFNPTPPPALITPEDPAIWSPR